MEKIKIKYGGEKTMGFIALKAQINPIISIGLFSLLFIVSSCTTNSNDEERDLFTTKAILEGVVYEYGSEKTVENANIYVSDRNRGGCIEESNLSMIVKLDSIVSYDNGFYQLSIRDLNLVGPMCYKIFATYTGGDRLVASDTLLFEIELRANPPYDTVAVDLVLE